MGSSVSWRGGVYVECDELEIAGQFQEEVMSRRTISKQRNRERF